MLCEVHFYLLEMLGSTSIGVHSVLEKFIYFVLQFVASNGIARHWDWQIIDPRAAVQTLGYLRLQCTKVVCL